MEYGRTKSVDDVASELAGSTEDGGGMASERGAGKEFVRIDSWF